jgi:PD-(D/E)XK nuclease superfamily protein
MSDSFELPEVTHSVLKSFRRCPKLTEYKYVRKLLPRVHSKPLTRGKWVHSLLETKYTGGDWRETHKQLRRQFNGLFDEEKEALGNLPLEVNRLFLSYLWHYRDDQDWKVLEVEKTIQATLPNGMKFKARVDMLVETPYGLYLVDHKTHKRLPSLLMRLLDTQSPAYMWACWENDLDVQGFIWNYIKTAAPAVPHVLKSGDRFSKKLGETDYYTFARCLQKSGFDPEPYRDVLNRLKAQRYEYGKPQTSPFFQRHIVERTEESVEQALREMMVTAERLTEYNFNPRLTERIPDRSCEWMCGYEGLCTAELHGNETRHIMRSFRKGDPLEYYEEGPETL